MLAQSRKVGTTLYTSTFNLYFISLHCLLVNTTITDRSYRDELVDIGRKLGTIDVELEMIGLSSLTNKLKQDTIQFQRFEFFKGFLDTGESTMLYEETLDREMHRRELIQRKRDLELQIGQYEVVPRPVASDSVITTESLPDGTVVEIGMCSLQRFLSDFGALNSVLLLIYISLFVSHFFTT